MQLTVGEKIKILLKRKNMTLSQLAEKIGQSRQNFSNKMSRDNFSEKEMSAISDALDMDLVIKFVDKNTGEEI